MGRCTPACLCIAACILPCTLGLISSNLDTQSTLAFIHVPYNFGHTVEAQAFFREDVHYIDKSEYLESFGGIGDTTRRQTWDEINEWMKPGGEAWGHLNPILQEKSNITGCDLFYTPPKYWPEDIAKQYIGDRTTFGLLRDPAERLVAMFRGNMPAYGGASDMNYFFDCDVDGAVRSMVQDILTNKDPYGTGCTRIPQADYFEGPYGVKLVIDNRGIPQNINEALREHGYTAPDWEIPIKRILHVDHCNEIGTWNLTAETKAMVRKAFSKDYDLLCRLFDYCDHEEDTCIVNVPSMCPSWVDKSQIKSHSSIRIQHID